MTISFNEIQINCLASSVVTRRLCYAAFGRRSSKTRKILASKSLSLQKSQISLATLIMALFYDLATEKDFKIPTQPERRERALRDLIKKRAEADRNVHRRCHDLHSKTLIGLKRLIEVCGTAAACFRWCFFARHSIRPLRLNTGIRPAPLPAVCDNLLHYTHPKLRYTCDRRRISGPRCRALVALTNSTGLLET